jgi:hypothetical protein
MKRAVMVGVIGAALAACMSWRTDPEIVRDDYAARVHTIQGRDVACAPVVREHPEWGRGVYEVMGCTPDPILYTCNSDHPKRERHGCQPALPATAR